MLWQVRPLSAPPAIECYGSVTWMQPIAFSCRLHDLHDSIDLGHAKIIPISNCITLRSDLVHMVEIFHIACGTSWKLRRRSWIRNGEEVELYHMPSIASRKRGNAIGPHHFSLR